MEARIVIKHTLDRSSLANLAQELASRLGYIVEFGAYEIHEGQHHFIQQGTKRIGTSKHIITLYDTNYDINSFHQFVIENGEEAKLIFNDIMEIQPPFVVDYNTIYNKFKEGLLEKDSYYNSLFNECRNMKIQTIYFIKDEFNSTFALNQDSYFADYSNLFRKNLPFFEFHL